VFLCSRSFILIVLSTKRGGAKTFHPVVCIISSSVQFRSGPVQFVSFTPSRVYLEYVGGGSCFYNTNWVWFIVSSFFLSPPFFPLFSCSAHSPGRLIFHKAGIPGRVASFSLFVRCGVVGGLVRWAEGVLGLQYWWCLYSGRRGWVLGADDSVGFNAHTYIPACMHAYGRTGRWQVGKAVGQ